MIAGKLVSLTGLIPEDHPHLFRWANDVDAARLNGPYRPTDWSSHKDWCENVGRDNSKVVFAIRRTDTSGIIGYLQIVNIHGVNRSADIGLRIGDAKDRGRGFGSEALRLAVEYCWNDLNLQRLALAVFDGNGPALAIYQAAGFTREGVLRRAVYTGGRFVDVIVMAKLREES